MFAIPLIELARCILLCVDHPVLLPIKPGLSAGTNAEVLPGGGIAVLCQHADAELAQEVQVGLPLAGDPQAQTQGVKSADAEAPLGYKEPQFLDPIGHPRQDKS